MHVVTALLLTFRVRQQAVRRIQSMNTQSTPFPCEGTGPPQRPQTLRQGLAVYQRLYLPARNPAERARYQYGHDLADLLSFLEQAGLHDLAQVSLRNLEAYLAELERRGLSGSSRRRRVYACKSFFGFLYRSGYTEQNVAERLIAHHAAQRTPRVLSQAEREALLRACSHHARDAALIELLLQTGLRLSEVARLTVQDVELPVGIGRDAKTTGRLRVVGEGDKEHWVPLNDRACRALEAWLGVRPAFGSQALFVSRFGVRMGLQGMQRLVRRCLAEAGIRGATVRALRHPWATHRVAKGTSLPTVQEARGRADRETTSIEAHLTEEAARRELEEHAL